MKLKRFKQLWETVVSTPTVSNKIETIGGMKRGTARKIIQATKDNKSLTLSSIKNQQTDVQKNELK